MEPRKIEIESNFKIQYSICTLVTDQIQYGEMMESFIKAGFSVDDCEFIIADNTRANDFDAYSAINRFLREASGKYIIICHQDVLIEYDKEPLLKTRLQELDKLDARWGIVGNAGAKDLYNTPMAITENGELFRKGELPSKVSSLDENFILLKAESNLAVSADISGYHLYGTDICLIAECLGWNCYVINFNITHKSSGRLNASFHEISRKLQLKYRHFFRGRYIRTTITRFYLGSSWTSGLMNIPLIKNIARLYYKYMVK